MNIPLDTLLTGEMSMMGIVMIAAVAFLNKSIAALIEKRLGQYSALIVTSLADGKIDMDEATKIVEQSKKLFQGDKT